MYPKINGYAITPYDVGGRLCYAIRDGKVGNLIKNQEGISLIFATEQAANNIAKSAVHCTKLNNFVMEI